MDDTKAGSFDFDDWAELYRCDPAAFEARRQAVLMLEIARGEPRQRDVARAALARYERAAGGRDGMTRAVLSAGFMRDSLCELKRNLDRLGTGVDRVLATLPDEADADRKP